jgi:hypothetical protein
MSQDAEQPKSRRDLRRAQMPVSSTPDAAPEREYPSVPLLPPSGLPADADPLPPAAGHRDRGAHAAEAARTRQARRAEERARLAAEAAGFQVSESAVPELPVAPPAAAANAARPRRALDTPLDSVAASGAGGSGTAEPKAERNSQVRARNRAALRAYREVAEPARAEEPLPSRRLLRQQQVEAERAPATNPQGLTAVPVAPAVVAGSTELPSPTRRSLSPEAGVPDGPAVAAADSAGAAVPAGFAGLSIPEALAERDALLEDVRAFTASLPQNADPLAVDLDVLAEQKALAERAAILNERALARARLAEESAEARQRLNDPTAAHNLAMVTPLQFVKVPGVDGPVLKPPATSHVPVVTRSSPITPAPLRPPATPPRSMPAVPKSAVPESAVPESAAETGGATPVAATGRPVAAARHGRAQVLRRAEEAAALRPRSAKLLRTAGPGSADEAEVEPLPAQSAHGLEPLDAMTAGLGRVQRNRILQWGVAVVGLAALIAGITMIITTMAR